MNVLRDGLEPLFERCGRRLAVTNLGDELLDGVSQAENLDVHRDLFRVSNGVRGGCGRGDLVEVGFDAVDAAQENLKRFTKTRWVLRGVGRGSRGGRALGRTNDQRRNGVRTGERDAQEVVES